MKKKLVISGEVHEVGYRPFLLGIAESLEIERFFADNTKINGSKAVYVLVDSSPEKVESFIEIVRKRHPERARVESINVEDYKGNVMKTENYYRYLSAMQLSKIANTGGKMLEKQDEMIKKMDLMLEKQDLMLEKQDLMLEKQDLMLEKQDTMLSKQDETVSELKNVRAEVARVGSRLDKTNDLLEERFNRMEKEIERIKKALMKAGIEV